MKKKKIVFVGLSGGVDSAVSAALLKKQGYEVVGVFIKTWHPEFLECNEEEERVDAMRVAAFLNIPFLTFNLEDVYKKEVADYMIREYRRGRTPNPDVMCNKEVKFGAFLKKALSMGADFVATGHYAQVNAVENTFLSGDDAKQDIPEKKYSLLRSRLDKAEIAFTQDFLLCNVNRSQKQFLLRSPDNTKDQSYFLWTLKQKQLNKILFPIGNLKKSEVRKLAKKFNLPVAEKKDSQGICFLGAVDLKDFLKHYIKPKKGKVLNEKGEEIGYHDGVVFHTLGERHGFTITKKTPTDEAYYIVYKDIKKNILVVSPNKNSQFSNENYQKKRLQSATARVLRNFSAEKYPDSFFDSFHLNLENINWISKIPEKNKNYTAQIRYHSEFLPCAIKFEGSNHSRRTQIFFNKPILVASGQSCVIYDGDVCLGGGVVV